MAIVNCIASICSNLSDLFTNNLLYKNVILFIIVCNLLHDWEQLAATTAVVLDVSHSALVAVGVVSAVGVCVDLTLFLSEGGTMDK